MSKNLHEKPFDETTIAKLEIFEDYAQAWIPVFVMWGEPVICIFDFFAGTGFDKNGVPGSPIRILKKIREQIGHFFQKKIKLKVFFNEFDRKKYEQLSMSCERFLKDHSDVNRAIELSISNEDFDICFDRLLPTIKAHPSLLYLDQNGIRFLADKYLLELEKTTRTDFLYFVSSSYFWRFGEKEEFKSHVILDMEEAKKNPYQFIHRSLISQLRMKLPVGSKLKLYPFSLKKGANIHGIIFGASHPRAVQKFLSISWKRNETNGEANFDIDKDYKKDQLNFFEPPQLKKIASFQQRLREKVLNGSISNNFEAFNFALEEAYLGSHAAEEMKKMKKENLIDYDGLSPLVTYENVYQKERLVTFKLVKK
ncbi:MAG: three-Cys-motif partner protein TcmP [Saprospiraceae bacterium]|nr:three-Cys-motif partner protein TcmP [Saprospiraceae bacterium]